MVKIKEAILVEGRYDKNTLSQIVDAPILETSGFGIFKDKKQMALLRKVAETRGLIVFTDSDGAGFVIRNYLKGALPKGLVRHAYIPDVFGKEKRKAAPGKEGKLGVEGIPAEILLNALINAGVSVEKTVERKVTLTAADCMELGLTGCADSSRLRKMLMKALSLPENMTLKMFLRWLDNEEKLRNVLDILEKYDANA